MDEMGRLQEQIDACGGWELDRMMDIACDALVLPPDDAPVAPAFGRRAAARGPGHGPAGKARPAAAGRADQPPRRRNDPVARTDAARISRHGDHRHPRPLLPRQHHQVDSGTRRRPRPAVRGQLLVVARSRRPSCCGSSRSGRRQRQKTLQRELDWIRKSHQGRLQKNEARVKAYEQLAAEQIDPTSETIIQIAPGPAAGREGAAVHGVSQGVSARTASG